MKKRSSSKNLITIAGWFGSGNFGDELLLHTLSEIVAEVGDGSPDVKVLCADPSQVKRLHGLEAYRLPVLRGGSREERATTARVLADSRRLLLGPGTIFQERSPVLRWPGTLPMFFRLVLQARVRGARVHIVGAAVREGITPLGRVLLFLMGLLCDSVGVRDPGSKQYFGRKAVVIGDVAFALRVPSRTEAATARSGLVVSMRPLGTSSERTIGRALASSVRDFSARTSSPVNFLPMSTGTGAVGENDSDAFDDYFSADCIYWSDHLDARSFVDGLHKLMQLLLRSEAIIAMRLHAVILAILAECPTVAVAYEQKVSAVMVQLGRGDQVIGLTGTQSEIESLLDVARNSPHLESSKGTEGDIGMRVRAFVAEAVM